MLSRDCQAPPPGLRRRLVRIVEEILRQLGLRALFRKQNSFHVGCQKGPWYPFKRRQTTWVTIPLTIPHIGPPAQFVTNSDGSLSLGPCQPKSLGSCQPTTHTPSHEYDLGRTISEAHRGYLPGDLRTPLKTVLSFQGVVPTTKQVSLAALSSLQVNVSYKPQTPSP